MHLAIEGLFWILAALLAGAAGYLLLLTAASFRAMPRPRREAGPAKRFAVMAPAHNEEETIAGLLDSLAGLDYPSSHYSVFVVADNCTDATAAVARARGARVYERADREQRGKGYALRWLLERIAETGEKYDAFVIFDADSRVDPAFLRVMDETLAREDEVLQAHYSVLNPGEGIGAAIRFAALALVNYLRPLGKNALGCSTGLKGNGMCFPAAVIRRHGWAAYSLAEDAEHGVRLLLDGIRTRFVPEARVWAEMPPGVRESRSQNLRWEAGRLLVVRKWVPQLVRHAVRHRDLVALEAAIDLLVPPLSALVAGTLLLALMALLPGLGGTWWVPTGIGVALGGHVLVGLIRIKAPRSVWRSLLYAPGYCAWKLALYASATARAPSEWVRTRRFSASR